jgi:hypothetical protein
MEAPIKYRLGAFQVRIYPRSALPDKDTFLQTEEKVMVIEASRPVRILHGFSKKKFLATIPERDWVAVKDTRFELIFKPLEIIMKTDFPEEYKATRDIWHVLNRKEAVDVLVEGKRVRMDGFSEYPPDESIESTLPLDFPMEGFVKLKVKGRILPQYFLSKEVRSQHKSPAEFHAAMIAKKNNYLEFEFPLQDCIYSFFEPVLKRIFASRRAEEDGRVERAAPVRKYPWEGFIMAVIGDTLLLDEENDDDFGQIFEKRDGDCPLRTRRGAALLGGHNPIDMDELLQMQNQALKEAYQPYDPTEQAKFAQEYEWVPAYQDDETGEIYEAKYVLRRR